MPTLEADPTLSAITASTAFAQFPTSCANSSSNGACVEVFCGWPLSGQYGFGQRLLYYILVAACVLARREKWIRTVCIAAALLVPAVAAVHSIVLAALHVVDAVDADIYGALQFCSIGILAGPIAVKTSETYFNEKGRNTIFIWTGLILAGLLSLAVEFYRANAVPCFQDRSGNPISSNPKSFPYGAGSMCNLTCSQDDGPFSPMRSKAASEIFVTPKPYMIPFGYAMFVAAACCVPAIISLVSMRNKIVLTNWVKRHGSRSQKVQAAAAAANIEAAEAPNETAPIKPKDLYKTIISVLNVVEVYVFGGLVLTIVIMGEINFFSPQLDYHTEPMASVGQWGTIVATGLAILGSLFVYLVDDKPESVKAVCDCEHCQSVRDQPNESDDGLTGPRPTKEASNTDMDHAFDPGYRRRVSRMLISLGKWFGTTAQDPFGAHDSRVAEWPETPGERGRNDRLRWTIDQHSIRAHRDSDAAVSRASFDIRSGSDRGSVSSRAVSPSPRNHPRYPPPTRQSRYFSEPSCPSFSELQMTSPFAPAGMAERGRAATLGVPPRSDGGPSRRA